MQSPFRIPAAAFAAAFSLCVLGAMARLPHPPKACPKGYALETESGEQECVQSRHPETYAETLERRAAWDLKVGGGEAQGSLRAALQQKAAMAVLVPPKSGANLAWREYGLGPLVESDPLYPRTAGGGYVDVAGRVDSFDFDPVNKRLFVVAGNGGVWMSLDYGASWQNIGDTLPTTQSGAVAWTPANGGTLIVLSGDPTYPGSGSLAGLGAFWSTDLGATWNQSTGIPDGLFGFKLAVDPSNTSVVYAATSRGLFRSSDAGHTFANVNLPTSPTCAGVTDVTGPCVYANMVTGVAVKAPAGSEGAANLGGQVLAVVGYAFGNAYTFPDGVTKRSPGNGLYRSPTGQPNTFTMLHVSAIDPNATIGFTPENRIGRTSLAAATGTDQDHRYVYAVVQDAVVMNGGTPGSDLIKPGTLPVGYASYLNGIYVTSDFGDTWYRQADSVKLGQPGTGSALSSSTNAATYRPGIQAWYNQWIQPDPTKTGLQGVPSRLFFGLEEVWMSRDSTTPQNGIAQQGTSADYIVIGAYFAGGECGGVVWSGIVGGTGTPACPATIPPNSKTTTHPDQHAGIVVQDGAGGIHFFAGNDGGVWRQDAGPSDQLDNSKWGNGANRTMYSLLPYTVAVSKDGTAWFGLQDNGMAKISPDGNLHAVYDGDGFFAAVDPDNGLVGYGEYTYGSIKVSTDGGSNWTDLTPSQLSSSNAQFSTPFIMDPTDTNHLLIAGQPVLETTAGPATSGWTQVFDLGTNAAANNVPREATATALLGAAGYVGWCGQCGMRKNPQYGAASGIATNVGGALPPKKGAADGWHMATGNGLPPRVINWIAIDPNDANTIYVAEGGYFGGDNVVPGSYADATTNIGTGHVFKSTDHGENFTDISANLPSTAAMAIAVRGTQLLLGTQLGAFISQDLNGTQWVPLGVGMPNVPVTTLVLKPGDPDTVFASTYGRGIWCYSFTGSDGCDLVVPPNPVDQALPTNVDSTASPPDCSADGDGNYTLNFSYVPPSGGKDPVLFQVQEGTQVDQELFFDNADEQLSNGSNSKWQGTSGWVSNVNPSTQSLAYYVPDTLNQNETLEMKSDVTLVGGGLLTFDTTQGTETCCDFGFVDVSSDGGASWTNLSTESGIFVGSRVYDLTAYAGKTIRIRFRLTSDANTGYNGWYVENIRISTNDFATIATPAAGSTSYAVAGRTNGQRYYRIAGEFGSHQVLGPYSNLRCVTVNLTPPPIANAGADFSIKEGAVGHLAGTASDPANRPLTYQWSQASPAAPVAIIDHPNQLDTTFTAPQVQADTPFTFRLTVTNDVNASAADNVVVTVRNVTVSNPGTNNKLGGAMAPGSLVLLGALGMLGWLRRREHNARHGQLHPVQSALQQVPAGARPARTARR